MSNNKNMHSLPNNQVNVNKVFSPKILAKYLVNWTKTSISEDVEK